MGNRFSRGLNTPDSSDETAAPEQTAEESAAAQPAEHPEIQQAIETVCFGTEELVLKSKVDEVPDADPEPVAKETPAPVLIAPLLPVCVLYASESVYEPKRVCQLAPAPAPEPAPEPEPEPVSKPEPVPEPELVPEKEEEVEAVPEPISVSVPAPTEATEPKTDLFSQESLLEPAISSLSNLCVLDHTPRTMVMPPPPELAPVNAEEPSDIPVTEECQDDAEISVIPTLAPEKSKETSESEEKPMAVEVAGNLEQLVSVVSSEESISGLLKNLELTGNDLVADLISTDVKIPDDMCTSTELM